MPKPLLSTAQKAIIRNIAQTEVDSFIRIVKEELYTELKKEMEEEGYQVDETDLLAYFAEKVELWEELKREPDEFLNKLDELNLDMLRHILFQKFELSEETRGIWKKLNLYEKLKIDYLKTNRN